MSKATTASTRRSSSPAKLPSAELPTEQLRMQGDRLSTSEVSAAARRLLPLTELPELEATGFDEAWRKEMTFALQRLDEASTQLEALQGGSPQTLERRAVTEAAWRWHRIASAMARSAKLPGARQLLQQSAPPLELIDWLRAMVPILKRAPHFKENASAAAATTWAQRLESALASEARALAAVIPLRERRLECQGLVYAELVRLCAVARIVLPARSHQFRVKSAMAHRKPKPKEPTPSGSIPTS